MNEINIKVQRLFDREFKNLPQVYNDDFLKNLILKKLQYAYDIGHADGYGECILDHMVDESVDRSIENFTRQLL